MYRTRAWRRHKNYIKAKRKQRIDREVSYYFYNWFGHGYYNNLHEYSKNKIHCSCPMCRAKTGKRKSWGTNRKNWSMADEKRIEEMEDQILDNE